MRSVRSLFVAFVFVYLSTHTAFGQALIYPPSDAAKDIADALRAAQADHKRVLIDFGADWCPDCRVLGALFETPDVQPFIADNFHVVHVDVGRRDKNADIVAKYGATSGDWIPAVVVLDAEGRAVGKTDDTLRLTRRDTPATLLPILQQWAPKRLLASPASFLEHGVKVTLALERDAAGRSWLNATFVPVAADVHLYATDLPEEGIAGLGRPTRVDADGASSVRLTGAAVADRAVEEDRIDALDVSLPVYPAGEVTLRVPARVTGSGPATFRVSYMGCGAKGCLPPVVNRAITMTLHP